MLKQNEKCSSKSNSYLLKREKRTESHLLLERGNHFLQVVVSLSLKKKAKNRPGYMIPTMNCYPTNGQLRDPDFTRRILYHPNQQQYSQHPILWVVLNISKKVLRTRLIRVLLQHPIKQVGLTIHFKTSLVRNSDNIKYKT